MPLSRHCSPKDRKSTRLNSSHTVIYTLSLHDALPISHESSAGSVLIQANNPATGSPAGVFLNAPFPTLFSERSEEHTSELQSHSDLHSFPTRRSSDLA